MIEMAKSINQSFSYGVEQMAIIAQAEDLARKQGKSFSKYLVELIKEDIETQKKGEGRETISIMRSTFERQSTINEYDIKLFQPPEERMNNLLKMSKYDRDKVAVDMKYLQSQIQQARIKTR
jgi:hypothetical protein